MFYGQFKFIDCLEKANCDKLAADSFLYRRSYISNFIVNIYMLEYARVETD